MKPCPNCSYHKPVVTTIIDDTRPQGFCPICNLSGPFGNSIQDAKDKWNKLPRQVTYVEILLGVLTELKGKAIESIKEKTGKGVL